MLNRLINKKGNILIFVLVMGWISVMVILGMVSYAINENKATLYKQKREEAMQIAEAGITYYRWHLAHNKSDYQDGTGQPGPYIHEYKDKDGNIIGYYSLQIDPPKNGSTIITIYSTGWRVDQPASKRTIKVRVGFPAISDYSFLINGDLIFSSTAYLHGKTHANGSIVFDGTTDAPISSSETITGVGGPKSYFLYPVPRQDFAGVQVKLDDVRAAAQVNGLSWPYLPASGAYGYQLTFKVDGTVDVSKVTTAPACYSGACYDATTFGPVTNYIVPTSSYIFIDDTIWVNGTVKGRVTVATEGNDIIINGNLVYAAKDGTNTIGLMTDDNIVFPYVLPNTMEVDAALVTVNGAIFRPKYITTSTPSYDKISTQNFFGSRVSNYPGGMKYLGCGDICSGFYNTIYTYDANLTYQPPAGFPVGSAYNLISWEEVRSTTSTDFVPVTGIVISPSTSTVAANSTEQFTATVVPSNASVKNISWDVLGDSDSGIITANGLYTAPNMAGTYTVIASSNGVVSIATVTVTSNGNSPPVVITQPIATPSTVSGNTGSLSTLGQDDGGYDNLKYTWNIVSKPTGAPNPTFSINGTNAAKNTTVTYYQAGLYQFYVRIVDNNSLAVNSQYVSVNVTQTLSGITITPSPVVVATDATQQFAATSSDQFGKSMGGSPSFTWAVDNGSVNGTGLYTPGTVGTADLKATSGSVSSTIVVSITNPATAPTINNTVSSVHSFSKNVTSGSYSVNSNQVVLAFAAANVNAGKANSGNFKLTNPTTNGGTLTWTLVGNIANTSAGGVGIFEGIPTANLTNVTTQFSSNGAGTSETYLKIILLDGAAQTLGAFNRANGSSGQPSVTINATAAKSEVFAVGFDMNYNGSANTFTQTAVDTWNTGSSHEAWVLRTTNPTASAGNVVFTRSSPNAGAWNMAGVEVKTAGSGALPPTIATPAAASPSTVTGNTTNLSVLGTDDAGESNLVYSWSIVSKPTGAPDPTFSIPNNTNATKNEVVTFLQAGTYQFQATITDMNANSINSGTVTVTVNQTLATITISPDSISLARSGSPEQFVATSSDQFGNNISPAPSITWSATLGSITSGGFYTPPNVTGTAYIYAVHAAVTGTAMASITQNGTGGPNCTSGACVPICGDGIIEPGEQCDDGNTVSGDGCSASCAWETVPGLTCSNVTSTMPSSIDVPVVYRDFKGYPAPENGHADFERYMCGQTSLGLVQSQLTNGKPVFARNSASPSNGCGTQLTGATQFAQWYVDTPGVNKTVNDTLPLALISSNPPTYEFDSSVTPLPFENTTNTTQIGFFPLDYYPASAVWGISPYGGGYNHNYGFTTEVHYWFTYQGGEVLSFSGDDDVWVFINGKLALDLGGLHPRVTGSVTLNDATANALGLVKGNAYDMALFNAERHTVQSNFKLTIGGFVKAQTVCTSFCGDNIAAHPYEECDDGILNGTAGDCCLSDCKYDTNNPACAAQ